MPALFPRWSNALLAAALVGLAVLAFGGLGFLMLFQRTVFVTGEGRPLAQPVAFDHRHHAGDDAIDCRYCHDLAERSPRAGIPPTSRCLGCHSQIWNESPALAAVWRSFEADRPIAWTRVYVLPDFVFFDHSAHVTHGVGCVTCHGRVDRMARVEQAVPLTMRWCVDCHRDPGPRLRPRGEIASMTWRAADPAQGHALATRYAVAPGTDCSTCHR
ncbi:MAG TPA: cytochrome c3 family protein [Myxococcota bacterium]|nr:cytochrome c3 family protein [Myxococcota bacterium]